MRDSNIRIVQIFTWLVLVTGAVVAGLSLFSPNAVAQVSAITTEASRDIHKTVKAPVKYVYNGTEYSELAPVEATAGETVTIAVNAEGYPTSRTSWVPAIFLTTVFAVFASLIAAVVSMIFATEMEELYDRKHSFSRGYYYTNQ